MTAHTPTAPTHVTPLSRHHRWIEQIAGAQAGLFATRGSPTKRGRLRQEVATQFAPAGRGMANPDGCYSVPVARATLRSFDLIGLTSCLTAFLRGAHATLYSHTTPLASLIDLKSDRTHLAHSRITLA